MEVKVEVYGREEIIEATPDFWLKFLTVLTEASEYNGDHGYYATARGYEIMHDEIFYQTKKEILKK